MEVVIQAIEKRHFLGRDGTWVGTREAARVFADSIQAISFCIQRNIRTVRLIATRDGGGEESHFYPFGYDPVAKAERKKVRRALAASRRSRHQQRMVQRRLDTLITDGKEKKK